MKLTDEMRAAISGAEYALLKAGINAGDLFAQTAIFLAGYRLGHRDGMRDMRERAAKECDAADERAYPFACAAMIRALPIEDANG